MLTQQEQEEQQAVLQELLADPEQGIDAPVVRCVPIARVAAWPQPAIWSPALAAGAQSSHFMLVLGLLLLLGSRPGMEIASRASEGLLLASIFLAPLATLCSLLTILLVRAHLNGLTRLIGIITLPLNMFLCWALYAVMTFSC